VTYLLDTNVVSVLRRKGRVEPRVADWFSRAPASELFISVVSVLEIEIGVLRLERKDPEQGALLRRWKNEWVGPAFEGRVLLVDEAVSDACAHLHVPDPRPVLNSLIAATAIVRRLTLVTRNERDFAGMPVAVINPWSLPDL
jgi:toxin FitB